MWRESIQVFMVMCMVIVSERLGVAMEDGEAWVLARAQAADTRGSVNISMLCAFKHWGWYCVRFSISASDRSKTRGAHQAFLQLPAEQVLRGPDQVTVLCWCHVAPPCPHGLPS